MFTNSNFKILYSGMNVEREIRQPKLPGLETRGVYDALGIDKPVLVTKEEKPVEAVSVNPATSAKGPDLATIQEDKEDRAAMYVRK